jgi:pyridoxamine 5'-phosphate oxidase
MMGRGALIVTLGSPPEKVRVMDRPADPARISQADLAAMRREYADAGLDEATAPADPLLLWQEWLAAAQDAALAEVNAMVLSTVDGQGAPSSRMVLCKYADQAGFVFYTNYGSRKAAEIEANPRVSLLFPWHPLGRQVRIEGTAARVDAAESTAYFATRPRGAQLGAWASRQSSVIASRRDLELAMAEAVDRLGDADVPLPPHWGGYRVRADRMEFWQGRPDRLHDRLRYVRVVQGWRLERLSP